MRIKSECGFTILELSIALIIIGIIVFLLLTANKSMIPATQGGVETTKIKALEEVIASYQKTYNKLPCPARPNALASDSDYGYSTTTNCTTLCSGSFTCVGNVILGAVPFKELNVPENLTKDLQNNKVMYAMDMRLATKRCGIPSNVIVNDINGNLVASNIGYVVFSAGPNKSGAWDTNTSARYSCPAGLDNPNCNLGLNFVIGDYIPSGTTQDFDDIATFGANHSRQACPNNLSGCMAWLDFSDYCIYSVNPDTTVNSVTDKSPILASYSQANSVLQPQMQSATLREGNPYLYFPSGYLSSTSANIAPTGDFTISVAFSASSLLTQGLLFGFTDANSTTSNITYGIGLNNSGVMIPTFSYPTNQQLASSITISDANAHIVTVVVSQSTNTATLYVDSLKSSQVTSLPANVASQAAFLGNHNTYGQFTGNIYEVVVLSKALTDYDRTALEVYLKNKWALD